MRMSTKFLATFVFYSRLEAKQCRQLPGLFDFAKLTICA